MAGPRKAQYVSIPMGPGVLSNTTGRGAKTRLNYMNWDRWQDASWVRWHKLLPEKQLGWAFQTLLAANAPALLTLGSPSLLLHFNYAITPFPCSLLLHMDGVNGATSFPDSSGNGLNAVASGGVSVSTGTFEFPTGSASFDNTGTGALAVPFTPGGPLDISSGDFTIEFWFNASANPNLNNVASFVRSGGTFYNGLALLYQNAGAGLLHIQASADGTWAWGVSPVSAAFPVNTWTHIAFVYSSATNTSTMYVNGVASFNQVGLIPASMASNAGGNYVLGHSAGRDGGTGFQGFIDDFRLTRAAVYVANFVPAGPLTATPNVAVATVIDSSVVNNLMTSHGTAAITSLTPKFGNGSLSGGGDAASNVSTPITTGGQLDLSVGDFTVELWVNTIGYSGGIMPVISAEVTPATGWTIHMDGAGNLAAVFGGGASISGGVSPLGAWVAIAFVRRGNVFGLFVNGVAVGGTITQAGSIGPSNAFLRVKAGEPTIYGTGYNGQIDEVRITKGVALYTPGINYTPPTAEGTIGVPNTIGTINPPNSFLPATYLGLARDIHDWSSIDGQYWVAIGTHLKLYVVNQATLYDITPIRSTSNLANALTTVNGSNVVTVNEPGHQASTGDFVDNSGATVGGLLISGSYQIVVVDPSTYTIIAASQATAGATGGGNFSIGHEIGVGLPANGQLLGYGTGLYGLGTYGTPRAFGTGVFARMRTWSLDNYGQDLVASQSDGEIYYWTKNNGPNSRATLLQNAPQGCQRVLVDAQQQVIIALGCTDVTGAFNAMLVRWCSFGNITDWLPTDVNTAGDDPLTAGSRIITGLKTKGQNLIFTDTTLYRMVFVGAPDIYDFIPAGEVTIVGPNAAVDVDGVGYFMGFDNIYNYAGTLNLQACDVWETVFDPAIATSLNRNQSEGVVCFTYEPKTEVTWLYQSIGGAFTVAFTGAPAQQAVGATLTAPWGQATGLYDLQFSDQTSQPVFLTQGSTAATWALPLTGAVGVNATFIGNDRYVSFNWEDGTWYAGAWNRSCAQGRAPAMGGFPYGVNGGYLYQHETGTDAIEPSGTQAIPFFMRSLDITIGGAKSEYTMGGSDARFAVGGSDAHLLVRSLLPDWKYMAGSMNVTLFTKDRPQDAAYVQSGPVAFTGATAQVDIDAHGSQVVIQFDNLTAGGGAPSLGSKFRMGILQGLATPYAKR